METQNQEKRSESLKRITRNVQQLSKELRHNVDLIAKLTSIEDYNAPRPISTLMEKDISTSSTSAEKPIKLKKEIAPSQNVKNTSKSMTQAHKPKPGSHGLRHGASSSKMAKPKTRAASGHNATKGSKRDTIRSNDNSISSRPIDI